MDRFEEAFAKLNAQFSGSGKVEEVRLDFKNKKFFHEFQHKLEVDRWCEVAFAVQRKNGKFIVIRTEFYPDGVYRIPTGGVQFGEDIIHALRRESAEELGLTVEMKRFLGAVRYHISCEGESLSFASFVFWLRETGGEILTDATEDEICEYIEADTDKLSEIAENLRTNTSNWHDWCSFRVQTTAFIIPFLKESEKP